MILSEKSYSRVMRTLRGLEENINTVAFISAENPCGQKTPASENKKRNADMIEFLKKSKLAFGKIFGKYGETEVSYLINNLTKEDAMVIGKMFEQHSVIFGEKRETGMIFDMIVTYNCFDGENIGDILGSRKVFKHIDKNEVDFYSKFKGRKFQIPFFDEKYDSSEWIGGKITDVKLDEADSIKLKSYLKESLDESKTQKYRWEMRGLISNLLRKYN